jgi:hypothetical protein
MNLSPSCSLVRYFGICHRALVDESGMIGIWTLTKNKSEIVAVHGTICTIPHLNSKQ